MDKLEFRPTKILLMFWILGVLTICVPLGCAVTVACVEMDVRLGKAFTMGYVLPTAILSTYAILLFFTIRYELDDSYVTKESGVLWKRRRSIPLGKITNLDVRQGPFERLLGYGKIWIFTPSTGMATPEERLVGIPDPNDMKATIIERSESKRARQSASQDVSGSSAADVVALLMDIRNSLQRIETSLSQEQTGV